MSTQIRVTLDDEIYKQLVKLAKDETRSISNQALVIIKNYFNSNSDSKDRPTYVPTPIYIPSEGFPVAEPYKITLDTQSQPENLPTPQKTEPDNEYYKKIKKRLSHHVRREFSTVAGPTQLSPPPRHKKIYAYAAPRRH